MKISKSKSKGGSGVLDLFPIILLILVGTYLLMNFGYCIKYLDTLNELEYIAKKYMLIMETSKGMTDEDKEKLYLDLENLGIDLDDIDLTGTTFYNENVRYGDEIYLNIKVKVPYVFLKMNSDLTVDDFGMLKEVNIVKCTIALS